MATAAVAPEGALRVAAVWGTTVLAMKALKKGESFDLSDRSMATCAMPDGVEMPAAPLFFARGGWELDARGAVAGMLRLRGRDEDPSAIAKSGAPIAVVPGDYGLLQYGLFSIFFQYTTLAPPVTAGLPIELLVILALFSSGVMHMSTLGILRLTMTPDPLPKPLELTNPDELAARFGLHRAEVEVPPPPTAGGEKPGGSGVKDPGAKDKKPSGGGQKIAGAEGKLGMQGKADKTELQGAPQPAPSLGALSDVLNSDTGEEIKHTLSTINSVANALNGLNSTNMVLGVGTGTGLKGGGAGGGGTGPGVAFGAGTLQTGWGAGTGGGYGAGAGGPGGPGSGGAGRGGTGGGTGAGDGTGNGTKESRVVFGNQALASTGGLSGEQIRRVVKAHEGALRACYESEAQRNPNLRGGVTVAWSIDASGAVTNASLSGSTLQNPRVEGCIVRQVKAWHFPTSDAPTNVASYPFRFGVGG
jgi:hypothetical protein